MKPTLNEAVADEAWISAMAKKAVRESVRTEPCPRHGKEHLGILSGICMACEAEWMKQLDERKRGQSQASLDLGER